MSRGYALILLTILTALAILYVYMRPSMFEPMTPFEEPKDGHVI